MNRTCKNYFAAIIIAAVTMAVAGGNAFAGGFLDAEFDDATFLINPLMIDNPYWPLRPDDPVGCTVSNTCDQRIFTYIGETEDECVIDQISVNDPTYGSTYLLTGVAPYGGLTAVQVVDTEWVFEDLAEGVECDLNLPLADDAIAELTLDWYMQDDQQNIWYVGEASRDFTDGCPSLLDVPIGGDLGDDEEECTGGSWEAGKIHALDEEEPPVPAEAGIVVPSDEPIDGEPLTSGTYYMQEVAYEAEDMAKILRLSAPLSVEDGVLPAEYEMCRKVKEWNPFEPGESVEHKWYCKDGPGLVLIKGVGGGPTEVEVLVDIDPVLP